MIIFTDEQMALYDAACAEYPRFGVYTPLAVAVHTLKGKRILCIKFQTESLRHPAYAHYAEAGLSDHDMEVVTRLHGHDTATAFHRDSRLVTRFGVGDPRGGMIRESYVRPE